MVGAVALHIVAAKEPAGVVVGISVPFPPDIPATIYHAAASQSDIPKCVAVSGVRMVPTSSMQHPYQHAVLRAVRCVPCWDVNGGCTHAHQTVENQPVWVRRCRVQHRIVELGCRNGLRFNPNNCSLDPQDAVGAQVEGTC